ncbi:MAG: CbiQ family ECF transporter T component [Thermodesulfobacteriota bacterium]
MEEMKLPEWMSGDKGAKYCEGIDVRRGFVEKNILAMAKFARWFVSRSGNAGKRGLLQSISPSGRIVGIGVLIVACVFARSAGEIIFVAAISLILAVSSRVSMLILLKRILPAFLLTLTVFSPVFFGFFSGGAEIIGFDALTLRVGLTFDGVRLGAILVLRVTVMTSFMAILFLSTAESDMFKGLSSLPVPRFFTTALFMTFRYLFVLLKIIEDEFLSRKSRVINPGKLKDGQGWFAFSAGFMFERAFRFSEDLTAAMVSRGFTGRLKAPKAAPFATADYAWIGFSFFVFFITIGV